MVDSFVCQTVMSKLPGLFPTWKDKQKVGPRSGYTGTHFSRLQVLLTFLTQPPIIYHIPAGLGSF